MIAGLIEAVAGAPYNGKADLPVIASALQMEVDDLFPVAETLQLLRFAEIEGGDIRLTEAGKQFADAGVDERKKLFQRQLLDLCSARRAYPARAAGTRQPHRAEEPLPRRARGPHDRGSRRQTLRAVIAWARFAEAFAYDDRTETFSLDNPT